MSINNTSLAFISLHDITDALQLLSLVLSQNKHS